MIDTYQKIQQKPPTASEAAAKAHREGKGGGQMDDRKIVELYWDRSQQAIEETQAKYGKKLFRLAENLLGNYHDAEECVNDACLGAWNSIPPQKPSPLLPYLYKLVRNQALKRYHRDTAQKRGGKEFDAAFDELEGILSSGEGPEKAVERKELTELINQFLRGLSQKDRTLFLGRYWYGEAYDTIAMRLDMTENNCAVRLSRIREKLRKTLIRKGVL